MVVAASSAIAAAAIPRSNDPNIAITVFFIACSPEFGRCRSAPRQGLLGAGDLRVPIGVASLGVVLPGPYVDFPERRQCVTIRVSDVVQQIPLQRRRGARRI